MTEFRGAIVDVDGTLVRGEEVLPGAAEGLQALRDAGLELLLFSNNPAESADYYRERLDECGLDVGEVSVLTAGTATAIYCEREFPDRAIYVVGEEGVRDRLRERDLRVTDDPDAAEVVIASIDREFDYDQLTDALRAIEGAEALIGTDPDPVIPAVEGDRPGSGAIIAAVEAVAGRDCDAIVGKPSAFARDLALDLLGVPAESVLVVGDRPGTDIALGERGGMTTAAVTTGISDRESIAFADVEPDHVLDSLAQVTELLD